jgi:hypothetical protein
LIDARNAGRRLFGSLLLALMASTAAAGDPRFNYLLYCAGCHLADGSGAPPDVPDLRPNLGTFLESEAGRAYLVRVPGAAQVPIDDEALSELLNWMIPRFRPDIGSFEPFDAAVIGPLRRVPLKDPFKFRQLIFDGKAPPPDADL